MASPQFLLNTLITASIFSSIRYQKKVAPFAYSSSIVDGLIIVWHPSRGGHRHLIKFKELSFPGFVYPNSMQKDGEREERKKIGEPAPKACGMQR